MSFKELSIKHCYDSDEDDILNEFYIPALEHSYKYNRLSGFFRSSSLAIAAKGIQGLLINNGEMKLIAGAVLDKKDVQAIKDGLEKPENIINDTSIKDLNDIQDEFIKDHVKALSWMIANRKLEIKIAIVIDKNEIPLDKEELEQNGIFHQKIGIFEDKTGNKISFSGSVNESYSGWKDNIENFNVFREWIEAENPYVDASIKRFYKFWRGDTNRTKIIDLPTAIYDKLISIAPSNYEELNLKKWYEKTKKHTKIELRPYQTNAIQKWLNNDKKGIFEMATGTGKTFTALACVNEVLKENKKIIIIISCPYQHLIQQWKREIKKFGILERTIIADSSNSSWKSDISEVLIDISLDHKDRLIIITTHSTFSSTNFKKIIENINDVKICFIGDEVHGLGAVKSRTGLIDIYQYRLGLSATPKRWFDTIGTDALYDYFGGVVYELTLWDAINTINPSTGQTFLTPYRYIPKFISLNDDELFDYEKKSKRIIQLYEKAKTDIAKEEILELLLFQRANIIKNAENKYKVLEEILLEQNGNYDHTLVYCSPQQIDNTMKILSNKKIITHRFTMEQKTKPEKRYNGLSERDFILKKFAEKDYKMLVAMKCLDEGVDVPPARKAILMASSGNPREYIQRIGRVIRRFEGKEEATIYDIIVVPTSKKISNELREIEWKIFNKEIERYEELAKIALNNAEALRLIYELKDNVR